MQDKTNLPKRKRLRLREYDYSSSGAYFVTICVQDGQSILGRICDGAMILDAAGEIVDRYWKELVLHYPTIALDSFVVMPNHVHGIIFLQPEDARTGLRPVPTLSDIVHAFKTFSANEINRQQGVRGQPVWQRGFYERVVRDDEELNRIRQYIQDNPAQWELDKENPEKNP